MKLVYQTILFDHTSLYVKSYIRYKIVINFFFY